MTAAVGRARSQLLQPETASEIRPDPETGRIPAAAANPRAGTTRRHQMPSRPIASAVVDIPSIQGESADRTALEMFPFTC